MSTCIVLGCRSMYGWGCADLFHGSLREVMRIRSAGELIPIEGGNDPSINGALFEGMAQTACGTGSAVSRRDVCILAPIPQ